MKLSLSNSQNFSKFSIPSKKKIMEALRLIEEKFENSAGKSVNIKFCKIDEISALNKEFRKKDTPTNVLSFYPESNFLIDQGFLGEIAICPQIIDEEAKKFGKSFESRLYHLIIHAVLHLLGFSHENMHNRKKMESIEKELMQKLNFADPYVY